MTISAKIISDSISETNKRITTFELEYPRFIHSEFMTHRLFSRNAASSRAIPVKRAIELIKENTAMPIHWGKNQPGMSAKEECNELINGDWVVDNCHIFGGYYEKHTRNTVWEQARDNAIKIAEAFDSAGYHKQIVNRLLEPFVHIKVVMTTTELDNWDWLRRHPDAQPEIQELANQVWLELNKSIPKLLTVGSWHVPYYMDGFWKPEFSDSDIDFMEVKNLKDCYGHTLNDALAISASCCAQVSYRKADDSLEKAKSVYERLIKSEPPHFSPFEHQATPMGKTVDFSIKGVTHLDRYGNYWSGNFKQWIQHRQIIMDDLGITYMTSNKENK